MPVTIDIREDLRYQQGVEENKIEVAKKLLIGGLDISFIQNATGLPIDKLKELSQSLLRQ